MNMPQWYEELFKNYSETYDTEIFTKGTIGECDFIEKEISYKKIVKILDVGCGTGRHSIELSKRGYSVTGIDLSESQLQRAFQKASAQSLRILTQSATGIRLKAPPDSDSFRHPIPKDSATGIRSIPPPPGEGIDDAG
jgi:2-polyprenyl-3-methyl-5-hydroxy-6-metoxy-1,4-benzoquinol methylase